MSFLHGYIPRSENPQVLAAESKLADRCEFARAEQLVRLIHDVKKKEQSCFHDVKNRLMFIMFNTYKSNKTP